MNLPRIALVIATIGAGLAAGFFFAYEASVTLGLAEVDDVTYVETFQAINETVRNFWFAAVFFGTIPATAVALALNWHSGTAVLHAGRRRPGGLSRGCRDHRSGKRPAQRRISRSTQT